MKIAADGRSTEVSTGGNVVRFECLGEVPWAMVRSTEYADGKTLVSVEYSADEAELVARAMLQAVACVRAEESKTA